MLTGIVYYYFCQTKYYTSSAEITIRHVHDHQTRKQNKANPCMRIHHTYPHTKANTTSQVFKPRTCQWPITVHKVTKTRCQFDNTTCIWLHKKVSFVFADTRVSNILQLRSQIQVLIRQHTSAFQVLMFCYRRNPLALYYLQHRQTFQQICPTCRFILYTRVIGQYHITYSVEIL